MKEWTCWCQIGTYGGRPKTDPTNGNRAYPSGSAVGSKYVMRTAETIAAGCNLPSLGGNYTGARMMSISRGERSRITRRFATIDKEEILRRYDSRIGYGIKIPIPNELTPEQACEVAHRICEVALAGRHEYIFAVHRGGIQVSRQRAMNEQENDPVTGNMRLTARARALRKVLRTEENRHIHIIFRERPIGAQNKHESRWMQIKNRGVMLLAERFSGAIAEALKPYGYRRNKVTAESRADRILRPGRVSGRMSQEAFAVAQKQAIVEVEKEELRRDLMAVIKSLKEDIIRHNESRPLRSVSATEKVQTPGDDDHIFIRGQGPGMGGR